jgi:hypothetical protein
MVVIVLVICVEVDNTVALGRLVRFHTAHSAGLRGRNIKSTVIPDVTAVAHSVEVVNTAVLARLVRQDANGEYIHTNRFHRNVEVVFSCIFICICYSSPISTCSPDRRTRLLKGSKT